jgi:hypothetical protein
MKSDDPLKEPLAVLERTAEVHLLSTLSPHPFLRR